MADFVLSSCSTCDLSQEHFERRNIKYVCFHYSINGVQYPDDLGKTMSFEKFYETIKGKDVELKTSQVNLDEFIRYFTPFLEQGLDILHICMSSGLSGVYNSAIIAKRELERIYPERKIYIVDSLAASSGCGLILDTLAGMRDAGKTIDELYYWIEKNKNKLQHWVVVTDLTFLIRGGRVSKVAGFVGNLLKICPVLNVDADGKLTPQLKVRSKQKAMDELLNKMFQYAENGSKYDKKCYISHANCYDDAKKLADKIEGNFKNLNGKVLINSIGTTIGSHAGPGTVALFFWGNQR